MKRIVFAAMAMMLAVSQAFAASQSGAPPKFPIPWGNSAGSAYVRSIPQNSQIGVVNCAASLTDGFPPPTFVPASAGGCPPFGSDFNGILKQLSQWGLWQGAGATLLYDSGFSASIGGYPRGALLSNASVATCYWISTIDNNSSDPDTGGANWTAFCPTTINGGIGAFTTGPGLTTSGTTILASVGEPGGRLTNVISTPVITQGTCSNNSCTGTSLYFAPYGRGANPNVPIYDGTSVKAFAFTTGLTDTVGLTLPLDNNAGHTNYHAANSCFDTFYAYVAGTLYFGTGPAWSVCRGDAGTPARSAAVSEWGGLLSNTSTMLLRYGNGSGQTISVPAHQASVLGGIWTDVSVAGQVDYALGSLSSGGGQTIFGIWNLFHRIDSGGLVQDNSANSYNIDGAVAGNAWIDCDHSPTTRVSWFAGLPEDSMHITFNDEAMQNLSGPAFAATFFGLFLDVDGGHTDGTGVPSSNTLPSNSAYGIIAVPQIAGTGTMTISTEFPGLMGMHYAQCVAAADGVSNGIASIFLTAGAPHNYPIFGLSSKWRN